MKKIRAKFRVHFVQEVKGASGKYGETVHMSPVYSSDPNSENYSFSQSTPNGNIGLTITNPDAFGTFVEGKEFYIDFTPAA